MKHHNRLLQLIKTNLKADKRFEVVNESDSVTELYIYDVIDSWWGVAAEDFVKQLNSIDTDEIVIRINSPGGDAFDGRAIASAIAAHKSVITAKIDGLCASAATTIANACDHIEMAEGAFYMIHNAWTIGYGNKNDFGELAEFLSKIDDAIAKDYSNRTSIELSEIHEMMDLETWMDADEAKEKGFVDEVVGSKAVDNTFDLSVYDKAPKIENKTPEPKPVPKDIQVRARMAQVKASLTRR